MKQYNVWMEGYVSTGMYAPASFIGSIEANSFREACQKIFKDDCSYNPERNTYGDVIFMTMNLMQEKHLDKINI